MLICPRVYTDLTGHICIEKHQKENNIKKAEKNSKKSKFKNIAALTRLLMAPTVSWQLKIAGIVNFSSYC